ncbi:hypothetical protein Kpol_1050p51 [Vanderwaltozyma polyspora DSM 70294]|uniref:Large ribosomal subunit protein uL6m n=1 Tax=Vanderwaltozyma polyspora (strain ATCC 22028 / DSM 70294 / BCRC 21397 / CBS 2163 / NBRC 10782 / NRRL Y-8283 / UCD 57-17) TaxID=436907 RepID=A7TEU8_VANPO|nr:uncharacterized protein Kpol_1050p51 [Vanderwaltozyma polyspora DSM 70294]EDO19194.1 hypothetical protein Kpol_1050p51 [Vanderwaltozyma polyspora DSM 70294]
MSLVWRRQLSCARILQSHIGSAPVFLPKDTKVDITSMPIPKTIRKGNKVMVLSQNIIVDGPKGKISMEVPDFVGIKSSSDSLKINVTVNNNADHIQKAMWGTVRSHLNNHITGVNEGHLATLKFVGTGYRAAIEQNGKFVSCKVGASIPQGLPVPEGITVSCPTPTSLVLEGCNKQQVLLFAANLRSFHPPEPYKGKGIYVNNETIKIKDKKIK